MNLALLKGFCAYMQNMERVMCFRRIDNNLLVLICADRQGETHRFYMDMTRSQSNIFIAQREIIGTKVFCAPFDNKLATCTKGAHIEQIRIDGNNRILQCYLTQREHYKVRYFWLVCEFTGKYTNVVLCDKDFIVLEALRHIPQHKSSREVRVGKILSPLPQPECIPTQPEIPPENVCAILEQIYADKYEKLKADKRQNVLRKLESKKQSLIDTLATLPKREELLESAKEYAMYGELIFSSLHLLPTHKIITTHIVLKDSNANDVNLPLPSHARDLQEAGNWYFTQSKKYHKKAKFLEKQIANLQERIAFITQQIGFTLQFDESGEVFAPAHKRAKNIGTKDIESFFIQGYKVSIGRNAKDNQRLLEVAKADDLWFHIRDVPSAHLIIHCGKKMPPNTLLQRVAEILVGLYVVRKGGGDFVVDWTRRRFVKPSLNAQAVYAKHKSIHYRADSKSIIQI
ncbi:NFACT family protein [uncultured Helicobacter sp.]|uniref:NFACT family protein n=2 Tax=uncultured Helicobacter sp. TaxID=175537 RepID=UPI00272C31E9|nr:NFACT family protein [uncultured Helicobacter sp.]